MKPDLVLPDWIASSTLIFELAESIDELGWIYEKDI